MQGGQENDWNQEFASFADETDKVQCHVVYIFIISMIKKIIWLFFKVSQTINGIRKKLYYIYDTSYRRNKYRISNKLRFFM